VAFYESVARRGLGSPYDFLIAEITGGTWGTVLLVKAIICQESAWDPNAVRQEPRLADASRGLMQILYGTARWMGYPGEPDGLFDPRANIIYGVAYLSYLSTRYPGRLPDIVSAYNGGHPLRLLGGGYANQDYVDSVLTYYVWYQNNEPAVAGTVPDLPPDVIPPPVESTGAGGGGGTYPVTDPEAAESGVSTDAGTGDLVDQASGETITGAVDSITGDPVPLEQVRLDPGTGAAVNILTGASVRLVRVDLAAGTVVPVEVTPGDAGGSWGPLGLALAAAVLVLALTD
jgi:hypothetical protein